MSKDNSSFLLETEELWRISAGGMELSIGKADGCVNRIVNISGERKVWAAYCGDVTVRDDLLQRTFGRRDLKSVVFEANAERLVIHKQFQGAPWSLRETYSSADDAICWESALTLADGDYRSCAVSWNLPLPQPVFPVHFWAAKDGMPSQISRFAGLSLEYGEVTSGILMPLLSCYRTQDDSGFALAMPFDFKTPRFRFLFGFRELDLRAEFDWLALSPGHTAKTKLLLHGTPGDWRPALGWVYERFTEYFEPRSPQIDSLWGGHVCGEFTVSAQDVRRMVELGIKWYEVHGHFPAYGNYHPEGIPQWKSGHFRSNETMISEAMIQQTIQTLHDAGVAAFLYLQVTGDGDEKLLAPEMEACRQKDRCGQNWSGWEKTYMMNSDPALPFGKEIDRQIDGITARYPEADGIFLDQPCYNFVDTAHDDGITAIDNQPAYMSGFNYFPHLEHLSRLMHPEKPMIANGPFGVGILKYFDAFMAESDSWLCEHLQYYGIGAKPLFFLVYEHDDAHIEMMFRKALLYGAGFASYPAAMPSRDLYEKYLPLLEKLYRRRWVFDPDPLRLPLGFQGNIYRSERNTYCISLVRTMSRLAGRISTAGEIGITLPGIEDAKDCILYQPGLDPVGLAFTGKENSISLELPSELVAGLLEITPSGL